LWEIRVIDPQQRTPQKRVDTEDKRKLSATPGKGGA
jgi:hypothetical protein